MWCYSKGYYYIELGLLDHCMHTWPKEEGERPTAQFPVSQSRPAVSAQCIHHHAVLTRLEDRQLHHVHHLLYTHTHIHTIHSIIAQLHGYCTNTCTSVTSGI